MTNISANNKAIKELLSKAKTIAVVGLSPDPDKPSFEVARYLKEQGYKIVPVRPDEQEVLGEKAYASLKDIPFPVDIVDVFRRPEHMPVVVDEAIPLKPKAIWMQLGIEHQEAARKASKAGIQVIEDRCILIEHKKHF
ncbi:MAG: CoA-binding protein [Deltaproteobacteria bacterium]|nr:CoA-binding protein [Deltaproteobacteria bacterium]